MAVKTKGRRIAGRVDMEKIKRQAEELGTGRWWKPKQGKNVIRILPPWDDGGLFYFETALHYGFQVEGRNRAFPCLRVMGKKSCPACEVMTELKEGSAEDKKLASRLEPRRKFYVNLIDRANPEVVQVGSFSGKGLRTLLNYMQDPDWGDFTDPEEGHDVVVERTGSTMTDTRYDIRIKPKPSEVGVEDWEEKLVNLAEDVVEEIDEDEFQQIVDENFREAPPKRKSSSRDEDDEEETEDEEEEETPPKRARKDEDDEGEEEDEEDDKPHKRGNGKRR